MPTWLINAPAPSSKLIFSMSCRSREGGERGHGRERGRHQEGRLPSQKGKWNWWRSCHKPLVHWLRGECWGADDVSVVALLTGSRAPSPPSPVPRRGNATLTTTSWRTCTATPENCSYQQRLLILEDLIRAQQVHVHVHVYYLTIHPSKHKTFV